MAYFTRLSSHVHSHFVEVDLDQNSDAWLDWRKTGLGSSDAPALLGESPWKTRRELFEEKLLSYWGHKAPVSSAQFQAIRASVQARESKNLTAKNRGKKLEDPARKEYEALMGYPVPPACGTHAIHEFLKVSLDGLNRERSVIVEIKAPNQNSHNKALDGRVPENYVAQVLHQVLVAGCYRVDYTSFHPTNPPGQRLAVVPVTPETSRQALGIDAQLADLVETVRQAEVDFWGCVLSGEYKELGE